MLSLFVEKKLLTSQLSGLGILFRSQLTTDMVCITEFTAEFHLPIYLTLCSDHSIDFETEMYDSFSLILYKKLYIGGLGFYSI